MSKSDPPSRDTPSDQETLVKHVAAIHVGARLTLVQRKAVNVLLNHAYPSLLDCEEHEIRLKDIANAIGLNSNNLESLKDALRRLNSTRVEWNILGKDNQEEEWATTTMLAQAKISKGWLNYAYSPELRRHLYRPEIYARINLAIQRTFRSSHALALYENCVRFRDVGSTGWISVEDFRKLMGVDDDEYYQVFKRLNDKIIKAGVREVNATSDIEVEVEYKRYKRRVTELRFRVKKNPQLQLFVLDDIPAERHRPSAADRDHPLYQRLSAYGLHPNQIELVLNDYQPEQIVENLRLVDADFEKGKVHNLAAYALSAIRNDYRPKLSAKEVQAQRIEDDRRKERERAAVAAKARERAVQQRSDDAKSRFEAHIKSLSGKQEKALKERFSQAVRDDRINATVRRLLEKSGFRSPIVRSHFQAFVLEMLD